MSEQNNLEQSNTEQTETQKLSVEERLLNVEENLRFFKDVVEANTNSYQELIKALNKLMETNQKNDSELSKWIDTVEERLGRVMVENVNLSLIVGEAITLTPEQRKNIDKKILDIKKKHKERNKK